MKFYVGEGVFQRPKYHAYFAALTTTHGQCIHPLQSAAVSNSDFRRIETLTAAEFVLMFKTHNVKITSYKMLSYRRETALQGAL